MNKTTFKNIGVTVKGGLVRAGDATENGIEKAYHASKEAVVEKAIPATGKFFKTHASKRAERTEVRKAAKAAEAEKAETDKA